MLTYAPGYNAFCHSCRPPFPLADVSMRQQTSADVTRELRKLLDVPPLLDLLLLWATSAFEC
jgi:hypothetical protein